ncbi:MAG TPA: hypothetical protein VGH38_21920 [Bryobacteraceae bacterium]
MTDLLDRGEEIRCRRETNGTLAELAAGNYLGLKLILLSEKQTLADRDLAPGTNQALPIVGIMPQLAGEQDFNAATKEFARGGVARAQGLRLKTLTASIKPRWKNFGVVEYDQISPLQQAGEITKLAILEGTGQLRKVQQARGGSIRQGLLGDQLFWKFVVKIGNQHALRL